MYKKPSKKVLKSKESKFRLLKKQIAEAQVMSQGSDTPFWKSMKSMLKRDLEGIELKLDNYKIYSEIEKNEMLAARQLLKTLIDKPDYYRSHYEKGCAELEKIKKEISGYRAKLSKN